MNNILNELKEARKYMIETDDNVLGRVCFSGHLPKTG